jgi:hypothetical protein
MKNDYRKLLKVIRHSENQTSHIESIEAMVDMFVEKWKPHSEHPLYHKAHIRIEAELQWLKDSLNQENE